MKILLGQLNANGDCLYATILARQLRNDYPEAEITWAISSQCRDVVRNNPHIDTVLEIPIGSPKEREKVWNAFEHEALRQYRQRDFDAVYLSQIWPNNFQNYDGTVRPSILRAYGKPITVPIENVIELTREEVDRVDAFAASHSLGERGSVYLFECSARSGQSFVTPDLAQDVAAEIYRIEPDSCVVFVSDTPMNLRDKRSVHAGELTLRESAHLTNYGHVFIGCGSGCSVAATSTAARKLPMVQLLNPSTSVFASFAHDMDYFGIGHQIVEMTAPHAPSIVRCVMEVRAGHIGHARNEFGNEIPVHFEHYFSAIKIALLRKDRYLDAARSLLVTAGRYGWTRDLVAYANRKVIPYLNRDPGWFFAHNRDWADALIDAVGKAGKGVDKARQNRWQDESVPT